MKKILLYLLVPLMIAPCSVAMAETLIVKDGQGAVKYLDVEGDGTIGDPHKTIDVIYGSNGSGPEAVKIHDGAVFTHPDPHDAAEYSVHLTKATGITDTMSVASLKGDQTVTVGNGSQWAVGNKLKFDDITDDANSEYDLLTIKVISTNDLTFDRPLDAAHAINSTLTGVTQNLAVDGSSTPQTFSIEPRVGTKIHIHSINIIFTSATEPSLELYGGNAALTYGLHCKIVRTSGRDETYWIPIRSINALELSGFTYDKEPKVLGGAFFAHLRLDLVKVVNSVMHLDSSLGESFQCTVRDDTTGNSSMEIKVSRHVEPL